MPVGLALLTNTFPPGVRGWATGCALGVAGIATACGPFVGGTLTQAVSWRAVFWINVPLAALAAMGGLPRDGIPRHERTSEAGLGGAALGLANAVTLTATQAVIRPERAGEASG